MEVLKLKIVHVCRVFLDGFAYQENELAEMHAKLGHDVIVITSENVTSSLNIDAFWLKVPKVSSEENRKVGYKIIRLQVKNKINFRFWKLKYLYKTLCDIKPDLIFFHEMSFLSLLDAVEYKKKNPRVKLVVDSHSDYCNSGQWFLSKYILHKCIYRKLMQKAYRYIDVCYYITPNVKSFIQNMYLISGTKLKLLPLGGSLENMNEDADIIRSELRSKLNIPQNAIVIVSGGKLDSKKQTHRLVEAFNHLKYSNVYLIIFGAADRKYAKTLDAVIDNNDKVHLIGWIDSKTVYKYFLASDIACFPGGQSVLWQQAICCGLPLVVKDWHKEMNYLNIKENVFLLKDSDTIYIEEALQKLIDDSSLLNIMKINARTFGREFFSYKRIAQSIIDDVELSV